MSLSGFDIVLKKLASEDKELLYGGYSAGACVLAPSLNGLELVDDVTNFPYKQQKKIIWQGLNLIDFAIVPHYKSDHPESELVDKLLEYYEKNKINYKTLSDGQVIIIKK